MKYDIIDYGVTMDLQKMSVIEPAKSCSHWLKITLWKDLGHLVQKYRTAIWKTFFQKCCQTSLDVISDMGVTDHRHFDR